MVALAERILQAPPSHDWASLQPGQKHVEINTNRPVSSSIEAPPSKNETPVQESQRLAPVIPEGPRSLERTASNVARHEIRHAIVASHLGYRLVVTSIKPEGPSLGRVMLAGGMVNPTHFQIFAAASSAEGGDNSYIAEGTTHDEWQIANAGGQHSMDSAVSAADRILARYGADVIERAAQILDKKGEIVGSIEGVLQQAYLDVLRHREQHEVADAFIAFRKEKMAQAKLEPEAPVEEVTEFTTIETLTEDRLRVTITSGMESSSQTKCLRCGSLGGGHMEFCRHFKKEEPKPFFSTEKPEKEETVTAQRPVEKKSEVTGSKFYHEKKKKDENRAATRHPVKTRLYPGQSTPTRPRYMS